MRYSVSKNVSAIAILAQSFYNYPDPQAAAIALKELSKISDVKIDVTKLLERGEEIRLKARDIMKRTQQEMNRMQKSQEYDLPLYV
jgi:predicted ATP-grasp superfamily ATP-dependent carboligase